MFERQSTLEVFRERLGQLVSDVHGSRVALARQLEIDRTTLTQLLSPTNRRLPRVETLIAIARHAHVSIDWLLGLRSDNPGQTDVLAVVDLQPKIERDAAAHDDPRLLEWLADARGSKVRYVPSTLPDLLKTEHVIRYEAAGTPAGTVQRELGTTMAGLNWQRRPDADMECASSVQALEGFARGEGVWSRLPSSARREQLERIAELTDELYPTFRWFLYDGRSRYAAPVTVFGLRRAALYVGETFLVFTSDEHVLAMAQHFDALLRTATVQPPDVPALCRRLIRSAGL
jgi:transcriptional regulator with XRE-family HTH domain